VNPYPSRIAFCCLSVLLLFTSACQRSEPQAPPPEATVIEGEFESWATHEGRLDARRVAVIMSQFSGSATITALAPEGALVRQGDLIVEFDSAEVDREIVRLERDMALARSDVDSLEKAAQPLEVMDLDSQVLEADALHAAELQYLADSMELLASDLVSPQEIEQQRKKVEQLAARREALREKLKLTRSYLHPASRERARATLEAAETALRMAKQQRENCTVNSPASGIVVYRPLNIGSEYRSVRVGDAIFKNQPFMAIPDLTEIIVECQVPEGELGTVSEGKPVEITPLAYPGLTLKGKVEQVGSMASVLPGRPIWQKYFTVRIALEEAHPLLRSDMSVFCKVRSYHKQKTLFIPRSAVSWKGESSTVRVFRDGTWRDADIQVGQTNRTHIEVLAGLEAGERVLR